MTRKTPGPFPDEVRDAKGDDARLARARPREDEQRAIAVQYSFTLFRV